MLRRSEAKRGQPRQGSLAQAHHPGFGQAFYRLKAQLAAPKLVKQQNTYVCNTDSVRFASRNPSCRVVVWKHQYWRGGLELAL